ncbi:hypothetical protein FAZ79_01265 [Guyparkeria sp. SB14A]|uniref:DUF6231 family protein n=2 Tax=Guyparkeria TaxID=2035712 RepID=UPI00113C18D1|nr:DUF6231 family protein [Guyparkeria sp. SB14A]TKA91199.1 hypothetical protein FAZ79_01265 [Guyparkeria sp. SB14A]
MNAKKTPTLVMRAVEPASRNRLSQTDNRLIACRKPYPDAARLTVFARLDGTPGDFPDVASDDLDVDQLIARTIDTEVVIELIVELDAWSDALLPLFAALRDRANHPVIAHVGHDHPIGSDVNRKMVSLGFTRQAPDAPVYLFDIKTYKHTPDWLNARNWANPELWGKYRW